MAVIIDERRINEYLIVTVDKIPMERYRRYRIDGVEYEYIPMSHHAPNTFAIECNKSMIGKQVEFIF